MSERKVAECPKCGAQFEFDPSMIGKRGACPNCGENFEVSAETVKVIPDDKEASERPNAKKKPPSCTAAACICELFGVLAIIASIVISIIAGVMAERLLVAVCLPVCLPLLLSGALLCVLGEIAESTAKTAFYAEQTYRELSNKNVR